MKLFNEIYKNKVVMITGHTGFKGSWLSLWLDKLGAKVVGYSLPPDKKRPNHFELLGLKIDSIYGDVRDIKKLAHTIRKYQPEIIFHLAAQSLVLESYKYPIETIETNVVGTANLFFLSSKFKSIKAIINVTSDKCYENKEWYWGYRETDKLGGYDIYSASKACSEIISNAFRRSFFEAHNIMLATVRAGNVIGGGDWAYYRIVPDLVMAASKRKKVNIRNPFSIRPWQFVLEPLAGYLLLGQKLLEGDKSFCEAFNFGPKIENAITVKDLITIATKFWKEIKYNIDYKGDTSFHEARFLKLDCSKAIYKLNWKPLLDIEATIERTISWYKNYYKKDKINSFDDLEFYIQLANEAKVCWIK